MTPEEASLFHKVMDTFDGKLTKHAEELTKNTTSTLIIQNTLQNLQHDLLGNGQPGRIQDLESKVSSHAKYIYIAIGGCSVLGVVIGWLIMLLKHK